MDVLAVQRDVKKLEKQSISSTVKFNIGKCQVLLLGKKNPMFLCSFGAE